MPPTRAARPGLRLALLASAQFVVAMDYNIVYVALPNIGSGLGFSGASLQWVVSAYAIGFGGFLLLGGRAVDRLGRRRVFLAGFAVFGAACLAGGFADNPAGLITARAVQGLGAALLSPATLALVSTSYAEGAARNRALAVWGAAGSGGLAAGALLGGVLTDAWGWRSVLFVMVPLAALALGAAPRLLAADGPRRGGVADFDLPGTVTVTIGAASLVFGLVSGPQYGWASPRCLVGLAAGVILLATFLAVEQRTRDPLVPLSVLRRPGLLTAMAVILVFQTSLGGAYYLFTTYLQDGRGYPPLAAGLAFLPLTVVSMTASLRLTPALLNRWGVRPTLTVGMIVNGIGVAALATAMSTGASFWAALPGLVIWGIGGGTTFPAMFAAAATGVEPGEQGIASALAVTVQQIGGALGLAVLIAIANAGGSTAAPTLTTLIDGLRNAGWAAGGASVACGLLVLVLVFRQRRTPTIHHPSGGDHLMTAATTTVIHRYVELWNEPDPTRRRDAIGELLSEDSLYTDPDWEAVTGPDAINTMIGQAQQKLGELRFTVAELINTHHDLALFTWHLGLPDGTPPVATGYDVVQFDSGKIRRVYGFFV